MKPHPNALLLLFSLLATLLSSAEEEPTHDLLPVFRTVLDERPRVLVVRMGPQQALAIDCENARVWKYWESPSGKPPVDLQGVVYNGRHGPQPVSVGQVYFVDDRPQILFENDDKKRLKYLGHSFKTDRAVEIRWSIVNEENQALATVTIRPSFSDDAVKISFSRNSDSSSDLEIQVRQPGSDHTEALTESEPVTFTISS